MNLNRPQLVRILSLTLTLAWLTTSALATAGETTRVSVASDGTQGNNGSDGASISADGRYVAFGSSASNLVSGDTNGFSDIYIHDRQTNTTTRVSVGMNGAEANGDSGGPFISADGRYVAFQSRARNLVSVDTYGGENIFVYDRQTDTTTLASVTSDGMHGGPWAFGPSLSADGRFVAFATNAGLVSGDDNGYIDIFVRDLQTNITTRVSVASDGTQANGQSYGTSISADGRYVAFHSSASNLVSGDTNGFPDIFVHDRQTNATKRVSVASDGTQANQPSSGASISADRCYVAFQSEASNLVSGDTNTTYQDIFVRDMQSNTTTRVSVASDGSEANGPSFNAFLSADGRYVTYESGASNLVSGDTNSMGDIFIHDQQTKTTILVSVASDRTQANGSSVSAFLSADGRYVAFTSYANNLVSGDTNASQDIFVHENDRTPPTVTASTRADPSPTRAASVTFTVTFSEAVTDVDMADFTLTAPGISGAAVTGVSGGPTEYSVTADTGTGSGTLRLDIVGAPSIQDLYGNPLAGPYTGGESYTIDKTPPVVSSITPAGPNPTNAASVSFIVIFSEPVTGVDMADFTLTTTGISGTAVTGVSGGPTNYSVTVSTGAGDGSLRLDIIGTPGIQDLVGNSFTGPYTNGATYTMDRTAPAMASITRAGPSPTGAASVSFIVLFSELVTSVDPADFTLTTTGISGAAVTGVSGGPATGYLVTVNTGTGSGTVRLDVVGGPSIQDLAGNPLAGPYTNGESYTIEKIAPTVSSITRANANPTRAGSVNFIVIFSEPVTGVDPGDFTLTTTGLSGAAVTGVSAGPALVYLVTVSTGLGDGTLRLDVRDNDSIVDAAGNPLGGAGAGNGDFTAGAAYDVSGYRIYLPLVLRNQP
ncbi:MAG: hypothetical protein KKA73_25720 [Chloroflexi bacterium]|nr:hypothetical protein [Chloroflexota bacterium]